MKPAHRTFAALALSASMASMGCKSKGDGATTGPAATASASTGPSPTPATSTASSASTSPSVSASGSSAPEPPSAAAIVGIWRFSRFDLADPATEKMWSSLPADDRKAILEEAPRATLEITPTELVTTMIGAASRRVPYVATSGDAGDGWLLHATGEGDKLVRLVAPDTLRIAEPSKPGAPVTLFARSPRPSAPSTSASAPAR
jgi:hypothetical protein